MLEAREREQERLLAEKELEDRKHIASICIQRKIKRFIKNKQTAKVPKRKAKKTKQTKSLL